MREILTVDFLVRRTNNLRGICFTLKHLPLDRVDTISLPTGHSQSQDERLNIPYGCRTK